MQQHPYLEESCKLLKSLIPSAVIKSILLYPVLAVRTVNMLISQPSEPRKFQVVKILVRIFAIGIRVNAIQRRRLSSYYSFAACPCYFYSLLRNQHSKLMQRLLYKVAEKLERNYLQQTLIGRVFSDGLWLTCISVKIHRKLRVHIKVYLNLAE